MPFSQAALRRESADSKDVCPRRQTARQVTLRRMQSKWTPPEIVGRCGPSKRQVLTVSRLLFDGRPLWTKEDWPHSRKPGAERKPCISSGDRARAGSFQVGAGEVGRLELSRWHCFEDRQSQDVARSRPFPTAPLEVSRLAGDARSRRSH